MPNCPPGLVWQDCGSSCERTCSNLQDYKSQNISCDESQCVAGCFCPAGMIKKGDHCVAPEKCQDCESIGVRTNRLNLCRDGTQSNTCMNLQVSAKAMEIHIIIRMMACTFHSKAIVLISYLEISLHRIRNTNLKSMEQMKTVTKNL